jgi:Ser/Thr protein kinase RdoA (MazF antagonist)
VIEAFNLNLADLNLEKGDRERTLWWPFPRDNPQFVLKAKKAEKQCDFKKILEHHKLLSEFKKFCACVECPLPTKQGLTAIQCEQRVWSLSRFLGKHRCKWSYKDWKEAGAKLARFHDAAKKMSQSRISCGGRGPLINFLKTVEDSLDRNSSCEPRLLAKQKSICNIAKKCMNWTDFNRRYEQLRKTTIHGDFCERNILWKGNEITGLIDLELLGTEIPSFDLCFFASEYSKDNPASDCHEVLKALLAGYCCIHDLDEVEKVLLPVTFLLVTIYRFHDDKEEKKVRLVVEMLERTIGCGSQ